MTLTLKTAKHTVGKYGEVSRIVEHVDDLTHRSVTREAAIEANKLGYQFTPCIVVTTAREALEAAWELAYEPEDGVIPAGSGYIRREREDGKLSLSRSAHPTSTEDPFAERRLLDTPKPEPEPEPWELSTFCYATGDIYRRTQGYGGVYWTRPGSEIRYYRDYFIRFNPKPVTIEGDEQ